MDKFTFIDHTADIQYEACGFSFEEALSNAALAMFTVMCDVAAVVESEHVVIEEKAETLEELAGYVLGDILAESGSQELFFSRFSVSSFAKEEGGYELAGIAYGEEMTPQKGKTEIKAVTMHEISVKQEGNLWKIKVILDL
jgi:SHS2 domain-containing protein